MHDIFLSVVATFDQRSSLQYVVSYLTNAYAEINGTYADFEFVIVDNGARLDFSSVDMPEEIRCNCYIVALAKTVSFDIALLAGLERANGDFTAVVRSNGQVWGADLNLIFSKIGNQGDSYNDVVFLQRGSRSAVGGVSGTVMRTLARASGVRLSVSVHQHEFVISRRALNWVVKSQDPYLNIGKVLVDNGFTFSSVRTNSKSSLSRSKAEAKEQLWSMLIHSSRFFLWASKAVILLMLLVFSTASINALLVRILGVDILGNSQLVVPGWSFTVIALSAGFLSLGILLYMILRVQLLLLMRIKGDPLYVIRNFGRI